MEILHMKTNLTVQHLTIQRIKLQALSLFAWYPNRKETVVIKNAQRLK
jgi:hypothetical protein